ncbi:hypothetical protein RHMOL_Rhmol01G0240000 [Rhododendron molle]|uniref:Uncharacterized protein n=1 Tax=Rhododendron molle TaxID=49168 RepID=A0ACC0Q7H4_RHOML|nr:hypothetical protein RHMOL_Rhmol01G0240000 [Rhododendron molle]
MPDTTIPTLEEKQLLAAFTGVIDLISAALPKAAADQNDEPQYIHAGGSNSQTTQPEIPLFTPHHLRPVLVGGIAGNSVSTHRKEVAVDEGYTPPKFVKFDHKEGSAHEQVVRFIESFGAHAADSNLCLCEFSKSLTSHA